MSTHTTPRASTSDGPARDEGGALFPVVEARPPAFTSRVARRLGLTAVEAVPAGRAAAEALDALASALALDPRARGCLTAMQEAIAVVEGPRFDDDADALALAVMRMDTLLCEEPATELDAELDARFDEVHDERPDERPDERNGASARTGRVSGTADLVPLATTLRDRAGSWRDSASHAALRQVLRAHGETFVERALRGAVDGLDLARHRAGLESAAASHAGLFEVFPNPPGRGRTRAWVRDVVSGLALPLLDPLGGVESLVEWTTNDAPLALWELRLALTPRGAWLVRPPLDYPDEAAVIARSLQPWRRRGEPRLDLLRLRRARAGWIRAGRRASFAAFLAT